MYTSGVKATAEKEASCISICHKAVESTHQPCSGDNKLPCLLLSPILIVHISLWTLSLSLSLHKQINTLLLNLHERTSLLSPTSLTYAWQLRGMLSGRRPNTADPWSIAACMPWMVSDQASSPPTQLFSLLRITEDDDDLVKDDRLSSLPTDRSSHGLNSPLPPQFLSETVSVSLILSYIELSQLVRYRQTVVTEFTGLPFGL